MIQFTRPSFLNCFTHRCIRDIPNYHETINFVNTLSHLYVNEARIHRHGTRAHMHAHMRAHTCARIHSCLCHDDCHDPRAPHSSQSYEETIGFALLHNFLHWPDNAVQWHTHSRAPCRSDRTFSACDTLSFPPPPLAHSILVTLFFFFFFSFWRDESDMCAHTYTHTLF